MASNTKFPKPGIFKQGVEAFQKGQLDCPYGKDSDKAKEFMRGFNHAYYENLKRWTQGKQSVSQDT